MPFVDDLLPSLRGLAGRMADHQFHSEAAEMSELAAAFEVGGWPDLSPDERLYQLERLRGLLHTRGRVGDSPVGDDPEYSLVYSMADAEFRAILANRRERI